MTPDVSAFHVTGTCRSELVIYLTRFDLIHLQKHFPVCNLGKKSHKDTVVASCKHIMVMAKQYQIAFVFCLQDNHNENIDFIRGQRESTDTLLAYLRWYSQPWWMCEIEDKTSKGLFELVGGKWNRGVLGGFSKRVYLRLTMKTYVPFSGLSHYARLWNVSA